MKEQLLIFDKNIVTINSGYINVFNSWHWIGTKSKVIVEYIFKGKTNVCENSRRQIYV